MAYTSGVGGAVTLPSGAGGQTGLIRTWNATIAQEIIDATTFSDSGNMRTKIGGMYDLKGTCEAIFDGSAVPALGTLVTADSAGTSGFVLLLSSGESYDFTGIISNIGISIEKTGQAIVTMTFESDGEVTETGL